MDEKVRLLVSQSMVHGFRWLDSGSGFTLLRVVESSMVVASVSLSQKCSQMLGGSSRLFLAHK